MRYNVITIEREYASGGLEIAQRLAQKLGIPCYGQEILEKAAMKLGIPAEQLLHLEENVTGSVLFNLARLSDMAWGNDVGLLPPDQKLAVVEADVIIDLSISPCVIVGRGASALIKDKEKTLRVFIHADNDMRIDRATNVYGIDPKEAEAVLRQQDKRRANYFKAVTHTQWKDADLYHLFLNSGKLGIEASVEILQAAVE